MEFVFGGGLEFAVVDVLFVVGVWGAWSGAVGWGRHAGIIITWRWFNTKIIEHTILTKAILGIIGGVFPGMMVTILFNNRVLC